MTNRPLVRGNVQPIRPGTSGQLAVDGEVSVPVNFLGGGGDILLVLLDDPGPALDAAVTDLVLESCGPRGLVRMRGTAVRLSEDLVRFAVDGPAEVVQRREFVRVLAPQPVTIDDDNGLVIDTQSLNISGGGMLLRGPEALDLDTQIRFSLSLGDDIAPVIGVGRVVRAAADSQRAVVFEDISRTDRERLIRFIFDRQRVALAVTRGDTV
jgi:hypothetical protein